jgi:hypothetical protein
MAQAPTHHAEKIPRPRLALNLLLCRSIFLFLTRLEVLDQALHHSPFTFEKCPQSISLITVFNKIFIREHNPFRQSIITEEFLVVFPILKLNKKGRLSIHLHHIHLKGPRKRLNRPIMWSRPPKSPKCPKNKKMPGMFFCFSLP